MDFKLLTRQLMPAIRGIRLQATLNQKLNFKFNKIYRWESGRNEILWKDFSKFCTACQCPLRKSLREAFSYYKDPEDIASLVRHFISTQPLASVASSTGISRHMLSRWLNGHSQPPLHLIFALIEFSSADFFRFLEGLVGGQVLPCIQEKVEQDRAQLEIFYKYPFLSALLSAIDLEDYKRHPTETFLAHKSKVPLPLVKAAIHDLAEANLLIKNDQCWETQLKRTGIRGSLEGRKKIAQYVFSRTSDAVDSSFGEPEMRFSWKLFSLNKSQYEKILQKYTEFFNELGTIIDQGQEEANKIYLFSVGIIDYDGIAESK